MKLYGYICSFTSTEMNNGNESSNREEPAVKKNRPEKQPPMTLCLRCSSIHNEYQLIHWLFFDNRVALGIADWFSISKTEPEAGKDGTARSSHALIEPSPIETVYVSFSRKPYFLIEGPATFLTKLLEVFAAGPEPFSFKDAAVSVMPSTGATVASQREKVISVEKSHQESSKQKETPAPASVAPAKMVPRSVRLAKK